MVPSRRTCRTWPAAILITLACAPEPAADPSTTGTTSGGESGEPTSGTGSGPIGPPLDCERPAGWARHFGGPTSNTVQGLAVDPSGNIFAGLDLRNLGESAPVQFGAFEIVPGNLSNIVLLKMNSAGEVMWVKQYGGPGDQYLWTLEGCGDGVVIQAEAEPGTVDLGGGPITERVFLAAFDGAGALRWTHPVPMASDEAWLRVADMACDADRNLAITGSHERGTIDLGGGPLTADDGFVARFDAQGNYLWHRDFGDPGSLGFGVAYTPTGEIVAIGGVEHTVNLGGGPLTPDSGNVLLAKLDGSGSHVWSQRLGVGGYAHTLAVDSVGRITIGGTFIDELTIGAQTYTNVYPDSVDEIEGTLLDGFLATTDPDGTLQWSVHLGSKHEDEVDELMYDDDDVLLVGGLADGAFTVRSFVDAQPTWSWCSSHLNQVYVALSGTDAVIVAPWGGGDAAFSDDAIPDPNESDVWIAKILR